MGHFFSSIWAYVRDKKLFFIVGIGVAFFVYLLLFDDYNIVERYKNSRKIDFLEEEIQRYDAMLKSDSCKLHDLRSSDNANIERFAREQFLMKLENEDIFIVDEE